ncbi:MAG: hypothetical protein SNJ71_00835 [Bacteroidales bacterium]
MSKTSIIIDGAGVTVTFGGTTIEDINSVAFSVFGERNEIDLTTIDATKWKMKLLGDLQKIPDITINKKSDPTNDAALYGTSSQPLVISYKIGKNTTKNITFYAQLKSISPSSIERAPGDGVNVDLVFYVTNLSDLTETGPAITTP